MSVTDLSDFFNGEMDDWTDKWLQFKEYFTKKIGSVLVIDPDNQMPISDVPSRHPDLHIFYADLAECEDGDCARIEKALNYGGYDGALFDNIDKIPWIEDKAELEFLVMESLKRNALPFTNSPVGFDEIMVGCRCKEYPNFLEGKDLQTYIIEMNSNSKE